jgi:hypothetical protein
MTMSSRCLGLSRCFPTCRFGMSSPLFERRAPRDSQLREQEKAEEDARAAAFDNDVGRNEWAPQFRRKPKPAKVEGEIFCAPKKEGTDGRRYEPAAADTSVAETEAAAKAGCKEAPSHSRQNRPGRPRRPRGSSS